MLPDPDTGEPEDGVIIQVPTDGNPLNKTLPELSAQVGCVIASTTGEGVTMYSTLISADYGVHWPFVMVQVNT